MSCISVKCKIRGNLTANLNEIVSDVAKGVFKHISTTVPNTSQSWFVEGRQSQWVSYCDEFRNGSTLKADCYFTGRNLHFNLYVNDRNRDW